MFYVKNLNCSIGNKLVCSNLTFELEAHARLAIIGRNGVGKSTLLKHIINPIANSIFVEENHITKNHIDLFSIKNQHRNHYLSYLPQISNYNNYINIENLCSLVPNKIENEFIQEYISTFDLPLHNLSNLSGGEAQLAYITATLIQNSKIILLDEPTTYLDWVNVDKLLNLIVKRSSLYRCVTIAIMHDIHKIDKYFTHLLYLKGNGEWEFRYL